MKLTPGKALSRSWSALVTLVLATHLFSELISANNWPGENFSSSFFTLMRHQNKYLSGYFMTYDVLVGRIWTPDPLVMRPSHWPQKIGENSWTSFFFPVRICSGSELFCPLSSASATASTADLLRLVLEDVGSLHDFDPRDTLPINL